MYTQRTLQKTVRQASSVFPVLLLTGARQVGKTTLLESCAETERRYVTLDDPEQAALARSDPALFFQRHPPPVTVDEIQYAPELFRAIKLLADKAKQPGMFWLTGSQKFHLMQGITESLAGRVAVLDLLGLSQAETDGRADTAKPFLPTSEWLQQARQQAAKLPLLEVYRRIWRGSYPKAALDDNMPRDLFYNAYIQTYLQRDVRDLTRVGDERAFLQFLRAAAARTGQLLNYADLARDVDIDQKTAKAWLSILETSGIIYLLQPYHSNVSKRLLKTPKLYFLDTGLCAYLTQWSSPETLEAGAMSDAILETWLLVEILKNWWHNGQTPAVYFYRDKEQREIDLLIERDNTLYPVEFKKTASPTLSAAKHFAVLEKLGLPAGHGAVICLRETDVPLSREVDAVPAGYL
ncbi:ATP-binding protein [Candidatus Thiothrix sp. Deng01]|uniref:ATP-binding protein n=1 Tax=Candidatus Thiothrix phosphatis TaxID=3112415 RepID=A0ABU6CSW1_9GAMM|nr:ATP-binding protein [Candidatus Thiothrix sp. Deng01]MEB4589859.1 ATP-binding protein [Candidatus Thiothrix sp. Deng01]